MFLSGQDIQKAIDLKEIIISFFNPNNLKGASYVFTLDSKVKVLKKKDFLDSREDPEFTEKIISVSGFELKPGDFAVFYTKEKVKFNRCTN